MIEAWNFLLILQGLTIKRSSWVSEEILDFLNNVETMKDYGNFGSSKCIFFMLWYGLRWWCYKWEMLAIVLVNGTTNRRRFRSCIPAGGSRLLGVVCALESLLLLLVIFHLSPSPPASDSKSKCLVFACPPAWEKLQLLRHAEKDKWFVYLPLPLLCFSLGRLGKIYISGLVSEKVARLLL